MTVRYNGIGETLGDDLVTQAPLHVSGTIRFVHYGTGSDANAGTDKGAPLKTLSAAVVASSGNDMIVLLDGHVEVMTTAVTPAAGIVIVGSGQSSGKPTAKLSMNTASNLNMLVVSGAGVELRNVWLEGNVQANSAVRIAVSASGFRMEGCYVECGQYDDNGALGFTTNGDYAEVKDSTFISTATSIATRPHSAVRVTAAVNNLRMDGVVFSGGTNGFTNAAYLEGAAVTRLKGERLSFLLGAGASLNSATVGYAMPMTTSGGSDFTWDA